MNRATQSFLSENFPFHQRCLEDWQICLISDLISYIKSGLSRAISFDDLGVPVITSTNLVDDVLNTEELKYWYSQDPQGANITDYTLDDGDILLNFINSISQIGKVCIFRDLGRPTIYTTNIFRIKHNEKVTSKFFWRLLQSDHVQHWIQLITKPAINQASFTKPDFTAIPVCIPPVREQGYIAEIVDSIDSTIAHTSTLIAKLKQMKAGLLHDLLTHGLDENGKLRDAIGHPEQFKDSPLGQIPKDWEVRSMELLTTKIVDGVHKTPKYVGSGVPFLTVENLTAGQGITLENVRYVTLRDHAEFSRRADPKAGDVLVSKDGTLGIARIVKSDLPEFSIFVSIAQLRPNEQYALPSFISTFFETGEYERQLGHRSAGTGLKHIHLEHFRAFQLATPSIAEQLRIEEALKRHDTRIQAEEAYLSKLREQKKGLMHDLLTGRVRVTDLKEISA